MSKTITSGFGTYRKLTLCYNKKENIISITQTHPEKPSSGVRFMGDCIERFIEALKEVVQE